MTILEQIKSPIITQFDSYNLQLRQAVQSSQSTLGPITEHLLRPSGKQMRPLLGLLTAELHGGINPKSYAAAMLIEMLHWATLIHDDVVDEAYVRRKEWTLGALLRSKSAVLVGDYLFSRGLAVASRAENFEAIKIATRIIEQVVDGELLQAECCQRMNTTLEAYNDIINLKTAVVIAGAASTGAQSAGATDDQIRAMSRFGELLGMAFQIKDDVLDIEGINTGKTLCNDLRERKITLPLICALGQRPQARREMLDHLRQAAQSAQSLEWLQTFIRDNRGVAQALEIMNQYHSKALEILEDYPDSPVRNSLILYAHFVVGRES